MCVFLIQPIKYTGVVLCSGSPDVYSFLYSADAHLKLFVLVGGDYPH